jgi:hypothetical protein
MQPARVIRGEPGAACHSLGPVERNNAMGFMRKALFVGTGGASGAFVKANSKKERQAKALEKQLKLQKELVKLEKQRQGR